VIEKIKKTKINSFFERLSSKSADQNIVPLFDADDFDGIRKLYKFKCNSCSSEFESNCIDLRCKKCNPAPISAGELELLQFIQTLIDDDIMQHDRSQISPFELDIFIPSKMIAIEFNGIYWHSEKFKSNDYHAIKHDLCKNANIHLIQIFEDEWVYNKQAVMNRLQSLLGKNEKIHARKCAVVNVTNTAAAKFLNDNHLQGKDNSKVKIGLMHNDELVSIMTFGKSRFDKSYEYELIRYCSKGGISVVGGANKLLKHFIALYSPQSILTYEDRRFSIGSFYTQLGFKYLRTSEPGYFYTNNKIRESRQKYQKHKLTKIFGDIDMSKTEKQIMNEHGFYQIYDAGHNVYGMVIHDIKNTD
jgi:hypothetical protein